MKKVNINAYFQILEKITHLKARKIIQYFLHMLRGKIVSSMD
jgi:hypothetical protein